MAKITKKAIKEAPKFMVVVDWKMEKREASCEPFHYELLKAETVYEAMNEAESFMNETVYLIKLLEKTDRIDEEDGAENSLGIIYSAVLTNRHNGWHVNDHAHSEGKFEAAYNPNWSISPISFYRGE